MPSSKTDTMLFRTLILNQLRQQPGTVVQITAFLEHCIRPEVARRFYHSMITKQQERNARRKLKTTNDVTEQIHLGIREMVRREVYELNNAGKIHAVGGKRYKANCPTIWAAL